MLLGQDLGRRHQGDLIPVLDGDDGGFESYDGFAGTDIALKQAAHGERLLHVGGNFLEHPFLRRGGVEGQNFLDCHAHRIIEMEGDAGMSFLLAALQFEAELHEEQFLENKSQVRRSAGRPQGLQTFARVGPVDLVQGLARRDKAARLRTEAGIGSGESGVRLSNMLRMIRRNQRDVSFPCPADS